MFVYGGLGILELVSINTGIPDHIVPYVIPSALTVWALLPFTELVRKYVANPPKEILHEVDPEQGDAGMKYLYPNQWQNLTVVDVVRADDGTLVEVEKERTDLHNIDIDTDGGVVQGHECEFYDPDEGKAYVSFFGSDVSGTEIRRHRDSAEYLKHEASAEKDIHQRLRNLYPDLVEQAVHNRMNYYIHVVEGEQVPGKKSIRDIINQGIKSSELQEYVEEDPDFSDMIDMDDPFGEESMAKQYQQMMESRNAGDDDEQ
ncbi:hypothetical protein [Halobacterium noricense]|uniref:hypothetical protein n=1 Tax=Halobacterium noricense TaxID=223182 RepID=UPI001E49549E|nr:hypothetical protein [Halobacterium noricense]UHH25605.1 hypothetical protein LT974_01375 [Halobacterium noricense]